jgi:hypothetical protein
MKDFNPQGSALLMNQSIASKFFCVKIFSQNSLIPIQIVNGFFVFYNVTWGIIFCWKVDTVKGMEKSTRESSGHISFLMIHSNTMLNSNTDSHHSNAAQFQPGTSFDNLCIGF